MEANLLSPFENTFDESKFILNSCREMKQQRRPESICSHIAFVYTTTWLSASVTRCGVKSSPNVSKNAQKVATTVFTWRFVYTTMKTRRFRVSIGHFISNENFFRFVKPASLTQKCRVFVVMEMRLSICYSLSEVLQNSPKVGNLLGSFYYKFCHQEFSKIAQSGHP